MSSEAENMQELAAIPSQSESAIEAFYPG